MSGLEIARGIREHLASMAAGEYRAEDLTRACLARIDEQNQRINAFTFVDREGAIAAAKESDRRRRMGLLPRRLEGIPFAVKDNFCVGGMPTTCASRILEGYTPIYDATAVVRLRNEGAVLLGKLNMDELAMGSTNEHSIFGAVHNPIDQTRVAGGSSGGSAAAVAAGMVPFALGSDTGGSVRQPAAFCGTVGLKPTYGALSRYGLIAFAPSMDAVGILCASSADAAVVLEAMLGRDENDSTTVDFSLQREPLGRPLRIGVVRELMESRAVSREVKEASARAVRVFKESNAVVEDVSLPSPHRALASYCVLSAVEAFSNLARFDGVRYGRRSENASTLEELYLNSRSEGFGEEVKRRILFGACMLEGERRETYLPRAEYARQECREAMRLMLQKYDLILNPTTPGVAFPLGAKMRPEEKREADLCAVYANLAGVPAITVPFGKNADGLPIGVQLTAGTFGEPLLFEAAKMLEEAL